MSEDWKITDTPSPLHNLMWSEFPEEHVGDPIVRLLRDGHSQHEKAWMATLDGHRKAMADPLYTPDANLARSNAAAQRRMKQAEDTSARAFRAAAQEIAAIEAAMSQVPKAPPPHVVQMISSTFKAMTPEERHKALVAAIEDGDTDTIGAVLFTGGPAYLYGINDTKRGLMRQQYQAKAYPDLVARKSAILEANAIAEGGVKAHEGAVEKLYDTKKIEKAQKLSDEARKALE